MDNSHLQEVTITNPKTGQVMTATVKTFETIYANKGFELATRENAKPAAAKASKPNGRVSGEVIKRHESASIPPRGAAAIAEHLGISGPAGKTPATDAGKGVAAGNDAESGDAQDLADEAEMTGNADTANTISTDDGDGRESAKRDRGRSS